MPLSADSRGGSRRFSDFSHPIGNSTSTPKDVTSAFRFRDTFATKQPLGVNADQTILGENCPTSEKRFFFMTEYCYSRAKTLVMETKTGLDRLETWLSITICPMDLISN